MQNFAFFTMWMIVQPIVKQKENVYFVRKNVKKSFNVCVTLSSIGENTNREQREI